MVTTYKLMELSKCLISMYIDAMRVYEDAHGPIAFLHGSFKAVESETCECILVGRVMMSIPVANQLRRRSSAFFTL